MSTGRWILAVLLASTLVSCSGAYITAKNEKEGMKSSYQDPKLAQVHQKYQGMLSDIYGRYQRAHVSIYKDGLGFTSLADDKGSKYYYLLVQIRPEERNEEINFDKNTTTATQRFNAMFPKYFQNNVKYLKREDLEKDDIDGLAFGVYWAVRDYYQCNLYGGFLEYTLVYMKKADALAVLDGSTTFHDAARDAEVLTSLDLKPVESVKLVP